MIFIIKQILSDLKSDFLLKYFTWLKHNYKQYFSHNTDMTFWNIELYNVYRTLKSMKIREGLFDFTLYQSVHSTITFLGGVFWEILYFSHGPDQPAHCK